MSIATSLSRLHTLTLTVTVETPMVQFVKSNADQDLDRQELRATMREMCARLGPPVAAPRGAQTATTCVLGSQRAHWRVPGSPQTAPMTALIQPPRRFIRA